MCVLLVPKLLPSSSTSLWTLPSRDSWSYQPKLWTFSLMVTHSLARSARDPNHGKSQPTQFLCPSMATSYLCPPTHTHLGAWPL